MAPYDAEARMTHKTFQRCKVTFFSPNLSIFCVNFLCQSQIIWTGKIILSARKQSMYQNKAWECVTSAIVNFPASRFQFIFRTAECTFTTAERTFRSAEYKTKACPYQIGTGLIIKFGQSFQAKYSQAFCTDTDSCRRFPHPNPTRSHRCWWRGCHGHHESWRCWTVFGDW